jgi:alpha-mannosidase
MHIDKNNVERRIKRFLEQRIPPALYRLREPMELSVWTAPGEPVPFSEAIKQEFSPFKAGTAWGRPWGTTWIHVTGKVPESWALEQDIQLELEVDLGFYVTQPGFQAEALAYSKDGVAIKGIHPRNRSIILSVIPGDEVDIYLEAASNPDVARDWSFKPTEMGDIATAGNGPLYVLKYVDLALLDLPVFGLMHDIQTLYTLMQTLSDELPRKAQILRALEAALDVLPPEAISKNAKKARELLKPVLDSPAWNSAHTLHAVGHAHIDSAWLWPLRETRRKVARTFSSALDLIDKNHDFVFAASSAQQYKWIQQDHPELFERIRSSVKKGRFVPIGGMWIEPDSNLPSGESLTRQLLEGKRFFMKEFGIEPLDIWLPDSFGYNGAFPQIVKQAGSQYFLTQKISWNDTNTFPHHTFIWEGIDGTQIFTHFPPADTYNSTISASELHLAESKFAERGKSNVSLLPFGWGNGGGGPTRDMVEAGKRVRDLEGSPKVVFSSPERFFQEAIADYPNPPVWLGELYLELHRATSTTQAPLKRGNRRSESLLREVELWSATAAVYSEFVYPDEEIRAIWEDVLLLQFHDILPGTSITWVHKEAAEMYEAIELKSLKLIDSALRCLLGDGENSVSINAGPMDVDGIAAMSAQLLVSRKYSKPEVIKGGMTLESDYLRVAFGEDGTISSLFDKKANRELVPEGEVANLFQLHSDTPSQWDAWDVDSSYRHTHSDLRGIESIEPFVSEDKQGVRITRVFSDSRIIQECVIPEGTADLEISLEVHWYENEKFLKLAFPLAIHTDRAASEIQYGHLYRSIHTNTNWDAARFETVAHRWVQVAEPNYGVAIANDSTYGYDISRQSKNSLVSTTVRMSLLRAPNFPDPVSDRGTHSFKFLLRAGASIPDAIAAGYELNVPIRRMSGTDKTEVPALFSVSESSAVIESLKLAEDGSGDVVVRLYESQGVQSRVALTANFEFDRVFVTDSLERDLSDNLPTSGGMVTIGFSPFQLRTIRFNRKTPTPGSLA